MKRIVIIGAYGCKNIGDEAILSGLLKTLNHAEVVVFSSDPQETKKLHNVQSEYENLKRLIQSDEVIIGGGELFQDHMARKLCRLIILSKIFGKKVRILGVGVDVNKSFIKFLVKLSFKIADEISVRDKRSFQKLVELGVSVDRIKLTKDFAFNLRLSKPTRKIRNFYNKFVQNCNYVILVLRPVNRKVDSIVVSFFTKFIKYLIRNRKIKIILFPFSKHPYSQRDNDLTVLKEIKNNINNNKNVILFEEDIIPEDALWMVSKAKLVISMRLHPLIFAKIVKTNAIAIISSSKVKSFAEEHNIPTIEIQNLLDLYNYI